MLYGRYTVYENRAKKYVLWGIPVLCAVVSLTHFIYGWSGKTLIAGIFTPVNESVWEHLKMTFWPVAFWWLAIYFVLRRKENIPAARCLTACAAAILICPVVISAFYYTYTGALGIESLTLDIISMILGITAAQLAGLHIMRHARTGPVNSYVSVAILVMLAAVFTIFTFAAPQIPMFKDPLTGLFGLGQ
jgi:hypothetical protein